MVAASIWLLSAGTLSAVTLGINADGRFFSIDGLPTFLNGVSYYAGCGISTPSFVTQDLDDMHAQGFNWIRVWTYWQNGGENMGVTTQSGAVREPYMSRLKTMITECNSRGMILDCSMSRDSNSSTVPANITQHLACAQTIATQLLPYRNVYIDIANERDVGDARFVSISECGQLINAIKAIDPQRLCTASGVPGSQSEMNTFRTVGHLDFIATHLCRDASCPAQTLGTVKQFITWMTANGFRIPVHLQEPLRRGYGSYNPIVEDFYRDDTGGKIAEAAGWCLHNGQNQLSGDSRPFRSFLMNNTEGRLYSQWDSVELTVTPALLDQIGSTSTRVRRYQVEYTEQISHVVGARDGFSWSANVAAHSAGYMTQGPSITTVPNGNHQATWRLKIDTNQGSNDLVVTIDVARAGGSQILASQQVRRQNFGASDAYQDFMLAYASNVGDVLEFRTFWWDAAKINLDWITLTIDPAVDNLTAPVIAEVVPDPDAAIVGIPYTPQLTLLQGTQPVSWTVTQAPAGTQINGIGVISGWTPAPADTGQLVSFTVQASNAAGSDIESWQAKVFVRADFDHDGDVDQNDFAWFQNCLSGDGHPLSPGCEACDLDGDGDVDGNDFVIFAACMAGANQPPAC